MWIYRILPLICFTLSLFEMKLFTRHHTPYSILDTHELPTLLTETKEIIKSCCDNGRSYSYDTRRDERYCC
jgi:hypothetical protein